MGEFFSVVGNNGEGFPPLRDTTEEVFSIVGYNGEQSQDGLQTFSVVSHNAGVFLLLYPTPQQNLIRCTVSHYTEAFSALYPIPENNIFFVLNTTQKNCGMQRRKIFPQRHRFSSVVSHNGRDFPPLWQWKRFFPL